MGRWGSRQDHSALERSLWYAFLMLGILPSERPRTPFQTVSTLCSPQGYAFVSSRRPAPSSFSRTLNSKASTFLCYLTIDLRTLPQAGPRDLLPQPKRTF